MSDFPYAARIAAALPAAADPQAAARGRERWAESAGRLAGGTPEQVAQAQAMRAALDDAAVSAVFAALFGGSPFLSGIIQRRPDDFLRLVAEGPEALLDTVRAELDGPARRLTDSAPLMATLRLAKRRVALLTALADIAGDWPLARITGVLSDFAARALSVSTAHLLAQAAGRGLIELPDPANPEAGSGYVVIAMGKMGAGELNYSSDIDLMVFYDQEVIAYRGPKTPKEFYVRLTRDLVRLMEERTADGYVFRTDLRLRPDPGSTAVAMSMEAAELYYEGFGQNWERAAMIKARAVAGDLAAGRAFLKRLRPFVWRKSLDFNAIQDIHSIKRQINAVKACGVVTVAGHNIKLGRGGIREVEFFAQTQQLIWGGREPRLQVPQTLGAIAALAERGLVDPPTAQSLDRCYHLLRRVEHRLQMIDDAQTQTLPKEPERLTHLARFLGYPDASAFAAELRDILCTVEAHYADLFEDAPSLSEDGNLVFTGSEDDPDTLATLAGLGFSNPASVAAVIRGWHHGRYRCLRSTKAREKLTELTPVLLRALGATSNPDGAFNRFDEFLKKLPAGVQIFALFAADPGLLGLLARIMGDAPRLADQLGRNPALVDCLIDPDLLAAPDTSVAALSGELALHLAQTSHFEEVLDRCRRWANDRRFQVGVLVLLARIDAETAGRALSALADAVLGALMPYVVEDLARSHGKVPGSEVAVLAMGKMGGLEMTATSDLDLIILYRADPECPGSDGRRPLSPGDWHIRLTQRFINAITALTAEGRLYEVDMRLRPSGNKGPLAVSLDAFERYNQADAWTWEHMALTRARVCLGPAGLAEAARQATARTLTRQRDPGRLVAEVAEMRARMAREHKGDDPWEVKHRRGGLIDIEFIAQYLQLRHAHAHPRVLAPNTLGALRKLADAGLLEAATAGRLIEAHRLWLAVQSVLRHCVEGRFEPGRASPGLVRTIVDSVALVQPEDPPADLDDLARRMDTAADAAYLIFQELIETPASQVSAPADPRTAGAGP
ncbi:bifunctional [glutamine synthetase] adenylyltransferase/[glutamine synthetase]-adenylyl-L-tyrosine phosphorylase [Roseospirillum parvum]|uniref:Bifunctional glutamine synthetase adenylyltransferase/adenylyl-removing enzyme n=1 Tax=Roseospirillum parvum TaxID=83401 RepID=A0A1G7U2F5_9PROT|nr:bifunctional [glutamine synthetase] adenylyltransferase/[glutamine synthetase]-adenylyl-L-tyrosine phosphorylase [Roseospirillum parvum]SDG41772.1 glutamate-ammonia-ligase adenylyltransferase [Roseospirillum parvum]